MQVFGVIFIAASYPMMGMTGCAGEKPAPAQQFSPAHQDEDDHDDGTGSKPAGEMPAEHTEQ